MGRPQRRDVSAALPTTLASQVDALRALSRRHAVAVGGAGAAPDRAEMLPPGPPAPGGGPGAPANGGKGPAPPPPPGPPSPPAPPPPPPRNLPPRARAETGRAPFTGPPPKPRRTSQATRHEPHPCAASTTAP